MDRRSQRDAADRSPAVSAGVPWRRALAHALVFSGVLNVLQLAGSFYMLHVYDRVLPSESLATLVSLTLLVLILHAGFAALDLFRAQVLGRTGFAAVKALDRQVFRSVSGDVPGAGWEALREVDRIRGFLTSAGPGAFLDLPWLPLYLAAAFVLHPLLGLFAGMGVVLLAGLTVLAGAVTRGLERSLAREGRTRLAFAAAVQRGAEAHRAMGMGGRLDRRWDALADGAYALQSSLQETLLGVGAVAKGLKLALQSCGLGLGAYLAIGGEMSAGAMIAASLVMARAFASVDAVLMHWRSFAGARQSYQRLRPILSTCAAVEMPRVGLPGPRARLCVEGLSVVPPGGGRAVVTGVSFSLAAGSGLGIVGPSGAGKSSLARAIAGAWPLIGGAGSVRIDGPGVHAWGHGASSVGFLPQRIDLVPAAIRETIARFDVCAANEAVVAAARAAGAHDLIMQLPGGYDAVLGDDGLRLSAGEVQRIALARALYGEPFLVVLDEPSTHLDAAGEAALIQAIGDVRRRGGLAVVVTHRASLLAAVDHLLVLAQGRMQAFGPKEEILRGRFALSALDVADRAAGGSR